jgi:hypothetical protein
VNTSVVMNVGLPCDVRSAELVSTWSSECAKEMNRSLLRKVCLLCDFGSPEPVANYAI